MSSSLPTASVRDTLGVLTDVVAPLIARGVIIRRPSMVEAAERLQLDARAVRRLQRLRATYGHGPVMLAIPGRRQAVVLAPGDVRRVLERSPEPFATASTEKRAALAHFQPEGVLISHGALRAERRAYNDAVLESSCPRHQLAARFVPVVQDEGARLAADAVRTGALTWSAFREAWFRIVRRVVLGDAARDDTALTDMLARLRADANWAFLRPRRTRLREQFAARLQQHLARAEPGSLASVMAAVPAREATAAAGQVPQWLFAFDAAAIATFRTLALLSTHPTHAARVRAELTAEASETVAALPYLRACVLESVRLWPTTPMILRESTAPTTWDAGEMPARTGVLIFAPFLHRDDEQLSYADRLTPELWLDDAAAHGCPVGDRARLDLALVPFSAGPGICPGRQLVLLLATTLLAEVLRTHDVRVQRPVRLDALRPLPRTLNHVTLRFTLEA